MTRNALSIEAVGRRANL